MGQVLCKSRMQNGHSVSSKALPIRISDVSFSFFVEDLVLKICIHYLYTFWSCSMNQIPKKCSPFGNPEIPKLQNHHGFQNPKLSGNLNLLKKITQKKQKTHQTTRPKETSENLIWLVVSTNPSEKYDRQNGNLPQVGGKMNTLPETNVAPARKPSQKGN